MDLKAIASDIPDYSVFLNVDELHASSQHLIETYPQLASLQTVGHTRHGDPIQVLSVGDITDTSRPNAFLFGGPHPNEPIGTMTIEYLSRRLCQDDTLRGELGFNWHFIKTIDADGMRLNEGWFKGPFTPTNYARHFFRPAPFDQVEWTFPISYKTLSFDAPMPETRALMHVIDKTKPKLLYSLHNAGFGGVYYYLSEACAPLYPTFHEIPGWFNLALDMGEPEVSYTPIFAPAIYQMISVRDTYDHLARNGIEDPGKVISAGTSSADYASRYGSLFLVVEMPYFDDPRVNDQTPTDRLRRSVIVENLDNQDEFNGWIENELAAVEPYLTQETLITRAVTAFLKTGKTHRQAERQWAQTAEETNRPATQAEVFSNLLGSRFYRLLLLGMFARMCAHEVAEGNITNEVARAAEAARKRLDEQGSALEADLNYRALPIRSLVGVQTCAGLATANYLNNRR